MNLVVESCGGKKFIYFDSIVNNKISYDTASVFGFNDLNVAQLYCNVAVP